MTHGRRRRANAAADGVVDMVKIAEAQMPAFVFASQCIGLPSEVWMWRQIVRFRRLTPRVLTWRYVNREQFPLDGVRVHELPFDFDSRAGGGGGFGIFAV